VVCWVVLVVFGVFVVLVVLLFGIGSVVEFGVGFYVVLCVFCMCGCVWCVVCRVGVLL
jgi:hypothetical protein